MTLAAAGLSEGGRIFMEAQCAAGPSWLGHRDAVKGLVQKGYTGILVYMMDVIIG